MGDPRVRRLSPRKRVLKELLESAGTQGRMTLVAGKSRATLYAIEFSREKAGTVLEECNDRNRKIRQTKVTDFQTTMDSGYWRLQGPLLFTESGELVDGQHRLKALLQSSLPSMTFLIQVVREEDADEANAAVDAGTPRNLIDFLHFRGVPNAERVAPMMKLERNFRIAKSPFQESTFKRHQILQLWQVVGEDTLKQVFDLVPRALHRRLAVQRPVLDWFAYQLYQIDRGDAGLFLGLLDDPSALKKVDAPYVLREMLTDMALRRQRDNTLSAPAIEHGTMLIKGWNLYYKGQPASKPKLRYRPREDFPEIQGFHHKKRVK